MLFRFGKIISSLFFFGKWEMKHRYFCFVTAQKQDISGTN